MANQKTLYRKYRPIVFDEVVGQEHVIETLRGALLKGLLSHAYLFAGPRGTGKTTIARLLAKALNCEKRDEKILICNDCPSCSAIASGRALDIVEIDAASNRGIDEIRELKEGIKIRPSSLNYKVFVIDEVHMLTREAFNALLKTLEEPPEHAVFIMATTELNKIPATILSRVQLFNFRQLKKAEIINRLKKVLEKEEKEAEEEALNAIAVAAKGSIRDAESILSQILSFSDDKVTLEKSRAILGLSSKSETLSILSHLFEGRRREALEEAREAFDRGVDPRELINGLIEYLREMLLLRADPAMVEMVAQGLNDEEVEKLRELSQKSDEKQISILLKSLINELSELKKYPLPSLAFEIAIIDFMTETDPVTESVPVSGFMSDEEVDATSKSAVSGLASLPEADSASEPVLSSPSPIAEEPEPAPGANPASGPVPKSSIPLSELSLDEIRKHWSKVVEKVKPDINSIALILKGTELLKFSEGLLTIGVKYDFYKKQINSDKYRMYIEKAAKEAIGAPIRVEAVLHELKNENTNFAQPEEKSDEELASMAEEVFNS